jgi:radical SAM superfamily enzyme YgiQ (UPF0313 family)
VAAGLRQAGFAVQAADGLVQELALDLGRADSIAVFASYASLDADSAFLSRLRDRTLARLVAFGPAMRFVGHQVLAKAPADAVLVGEAEGFFVEALEDLAAERSATSPRLVTPESVGAVNLDAEGFLLDLDEVPFPAWDLLPHQEYPLLTVLSSRGCPDGCVYCPYAAAQGRRYRARSVDNILAELEYLEERFRPSRLVFRDPVFAHDRDRVVGICDGILSHGLNLRWECESRPEHFDAELLRLMKRAGCQWVKIGLETTGEALLVGLRRVASAEQARAYLQHVSAIVRICCEIELPCRLFVMAGLPGQNLGMAEDTGRFVQQLRPDALNVKLCEAYPGTDLPSPTVGDGDEQLRALHKAQSALRVAQPSSGVLARGKRWVKRMLRGGTRG